jgi:uncharacterized protein
LRAPREPGTLAPNETKNGVNAVFAIREAARMRYIDTFNHFFPPRFFDKMLAAPDSVSDIGKRIRGIAHIHDLDLRLKQVDSFPDYSQILSLGLPAFDVFASAADAPEFARVANDGLAEICAKHPKQFPGYVAGLPMNAPEAAVKEAERAFGNGANGLQLHTNVGGLPLDDPRFFPIFEIAHKHNKPVLLHPARTADSPDFAAEQRSRYEIWAIFGWPYETSATMARLVFSGVMARLPGLKIVIHHMGAMVPFFDARIRIGWGQIGTRTSDEDLSHIPAMLGKPVVECFRDFYGDTALCGGRAGIVCGLDFFGADHVVFATDSPFDPEGGYMYIRDAIKAMESIDMSMADREKISFRNAQKMFGLTS